MASFVGDKVNAGLEQHRDEHRAAVTTWRYLRLALIGMAIGLAVAVLFERFEVGRCWQTSISAYYYTPVQSFFVGALFTIGVCLICLRGASDGEDVLLNLAGICAPFVALVPTPSTGGCGSVLTDTANRAVNIENNVTALLAVSWIAIVAAAMIGFAGTRRRPPQAPSSMDLIGFAIAAGALVAATYLFVAEIDWFRANAHNIAAFAMFGFIFLNVCLNAVQRNLVRGRTPLRPNRYTLVALLMTIDAVVHVVLWATEWRYWVLTAEFTLIGLFAFFWALQTGERWADGVSPAPDPERRSSPPPPPEPTREPETARV